jgi:hypothetical protein
MIVIWKGLGGLALGIGLLVCLITNIVTSKIFDENNYFQGHLWPKLAALVITGAFCWFLGRYLHSRPPRLVTDPATGQQIEVKPHHHLMFIKLEYWGLIFVGIALAILLVNLAG